MCGPFVSVCLYRDVFLSQKEIKKLLQSKCGYTGTFCHYLCTMCIENLNRLISRVYIWLLYLLKYQVSFGTVAGSRVTDFTSGNIQVNFSGEVTEMLALVAVVPL